MNSENESKKERSKVNADKAIKVFFSFQSSLTIIHVITMTMLPLIILINWKKKLDNVMITIHTKPSSTKNTKVDPDEFYGPPPILHLC